MGEAKNGPDRRLVDDIWVNVCRLQLVTDNLVGYCVELFTKVKG